MRKGYLLVILLLGSMGLVCKAQILRGLESMPVGLQRSVRFLQTPYPRAVNLDSAMQLARKECAGLKGNMGSKESAGLYNNAQLLIAYVYLRRGLPDSVMAILPKVDDSTRLKMLLELSHRYRDNEAMDKVKRTMKAMSFAVQARDIAGRLNDTLKKLEVWREIACIHAVEQEKDAESELLNVIASFQGIQYPYLQYTYFELSLLSLYTGNYDRALNYSQLALRSMSLTKDSTAAADLFLMQSVILRQTGQQESSLVFLQRAIDYYKVQYGDQTLADAIHYYAEEMVKRKRPAEAGRDIAGIYKAYPPGNSTDSLRWFESLSTFYRLIRDFPMAQKYSQLRLDIQERLGYPPDYYPLGQAYLEAGDYAKAKPVLEKAQTSREYSFSVRAKAHLEYCLFLADSALGNYAGAIRHLLNNKRFDDTVMKLGKVDAIQKYKTQYESDLKDKKISLLLKDQQLKDMYLERARFIRNVSIYGSISLLIVGVLMNIQYRQKRKAGKVIVSINEKLQRSLSEKEWLLKEMHHRVKNNLHTIICLLESQSMFPEKDGLQAIEKSRNRVYAMSLIHQMLYQDDDYQSIDMSVYLEEFIGYLKDSFDTQAIRFVTDVESVSLGLQQAINVALIINEGVTNSIKYAFNSHLSPEIGIMMRVGGERVNLLIADNGDGFQLKDAEEGKSLGMQLIRGLVKELQGTVRIETKGGTKIFVEFMREPIMGPIQDMYRSISGYEA